MTITLVGGPRNDEQMEITDVVKVVAMAHQIPATQDEPAKLVTLNYIRVPGQVQILYF